MTGSVIIRGYNEYMNEKIIFKELEKRFGAIPEEEQIEEEDLDYLNKRDEIEEAYSWYFNAFVEHFQLIKDYGLIEKLLEDLAWKIQNHLEKHEIAELKKSVFYKRFGTHIIIEDAFLKCQI